MPFYAHSGTPGDRADWQLLTDHLRCVANGAAENLKPCGLEAVGHVVGLLHDLGKYNPAFQKRLDGANVSVDHSTAGGAILMQRTQGMDRITAELAAYCILGHHAGLPDGRTAEPSCLERRCQSFDNRLDAVWESELAHALGDFTPPALVELFGTKSPHRAFDLSVVTRVLFSALIDADRKDTEKFYADREGRIPDREWMPLETLLPEFRAAFDRHMAALPTGGDVNPLRRDILAHVRAKAAMPPGLFTLTVPTGGGKTLASLGFALDHAAHHGKRRIIYAIPFTSIVDQTADIFRHVLGDEHILEHHSAIDEDDPDRKVRPTTRDRLKLAMEDWAAPVIVTTSVQLFESLFAARASRARKLHNIVGSIIILDEAQTIPRHLLKPSVRMLDTLARLFGCTIVLCTATQPALGRARDHGSEGFADGLDLAGRELAPDPESLFGRLRRAHVVDGGDMDNAALVATLEAEPQALVIVNSRKHALDLYTAADAAGMDGLVHLSTRQCAAHRRTLLADSTMLPVIIPWDDKAREAIRELSIENIPPGTIARKLQNYVVQIPPKARILLIDGGHVSFECSTLRGDQFAVLKNESMYTKEYGLVWENAEYLAVEDMII